MTQCCPGFSNLGRAGGMKAADGGGLHERSLEMFGTAVFGESHTSSRQSREFAHQSDQEQNERKGRVSQGMDGRGPVLWACGHPLHHGWIPITGMGDLPSADRCTGSAKSLSPAKGQPPAEYLPLAPRYLLHNPALPSPSAGPCSPLSTSTYC